MRRAPVGTSRSHGWWATLVSSAAAAVVILAVVLYAASWLRESAAVPQVADTASTERLPVVTGSEVHLRRAESLLRAGRLQEALARVEAVEIDDPLRTEADRLRAEIQRRVLASVDETAIGAGEQGR